MTGPLDVLRIFMEDALLDLPRDDYEPEWTALAQVAALVSAAQDVSRIESSGVLPDFQPLAAALAPFGPTEKEKQP